MFVAWWCFCCWNARCYAYSMDELQAFSFFSVSCQSYTHTVQLGYYTYTFTIKENDSVVFHYYLSALRSLYIYIFGCCRRRRFILILDATVCWCYPSVRCGEKVWYCKTFQGWILMGHGCYTFNSHIHIKYIYLCGGGFIEYSCGIQRECQIFWLE